MLFRSPISSFATFSGTPAAWQLLIVIGGEEITSICKLAVVLKAPLNIRMKRIRKREEAKFGNRVSIGGDLYESQQKFHNKVSARGEEHIAKQMQFINCPVLELDAKVFSEENALYAQYLFNRST